MSQYSEREETCDERKTFAGSMDLHSPKLDLEAALRDLAQSPQIGKLSVPMVRLQPLPVDAGLG